MKIKGKFNEALVFTDNIDKTTLNQIKSICDLEYFKESKIRIMPDAHAGSGCVIGTTMTYDDKICPNIVGVDIGCGVTTFKLGKINIDYMELDKFIKNNIPNGYKVNKKEVIKYKLIEEVIAPIDKDRAKKSLCSLGGGNHFIEVGEDENEEKYLSIHSGSRKMGYEIAKHYQSLSTDGSQKNINNIITKLKQENRENEIQKELQRNKSKKIPKQLMYIEGEVLKNYLHDMVLAQNYAAKNRELIGLKILDFLNINEYDFIDSVHNYIDARRKIIRKGAIRAELGEIIVVPMNMKDGVLLCVGKGNKRWNYSSPHGAGRIMSRTEAKEKLTMKYFNDVMQGIYTTSVNKSTLDEAPAAYKNAKEIIKNINDTVDILQIIKPKYNFKSS